LQTQLDTGERKFMSDINNTLVGELLQKVKEQEAAIAGLTMLIHNIDNKYNQIMKIQADFNEIIIQEIFHNDDTEIQ
jgi:shikimate 5-dehydrogenase